jgi:hypothetical protein
MRIRDTGSGIRDGNNFDPGWKKLNRDKHPGSATRKYKNNYGSTTLLKVVTPYINVTK